MQLRRSVASDHRGHALAPEHNVRQRRSTVLVCARAISLFRSTWPLTAQGEAKPRVVCGPVRACRDHAIARARGQIAGREKQQRWVRPQLVRLAVDRAAASQPRAPICSSQAGWVDHAWTGSGAIVAGIAAKEQTAERTSSVYRQDYRRTRMPQRCSGPCSRSGVLGRRQISSICWRLRFPPKKVNPRPTGQASSSVAARALEKCRASLDRSASARVHAPGCPRARTRAPSRPNNHTRKRRGARGAVRDGLRSASSGRGLARLSAALFDLRSASLRSRIVCAFLSGGDRSAVPRWERSRPRPRRRERTPHRRVLPQSQIFDSPSGWRGLA